MCLLSSPIVYAVNSSSCIMLLSVQSGVGYNPYNEKVYNVQKPKDVTLTKSPIKS